MTPRHLLALGAGLAIAFIPPASAGSRDRHVRKFEGTHEGTMTGTGHSGITPNYSFEGAGTAVFKARPAC